MDSKQIRQKVISDVRAAPRKRIKGEGMDEQPAFLRKAYAMISTCPVDIGGWSESGDTVVIKSASLFAEKIIPTVFKHKNFSSFVRQLNFYGFRKVKSESLEHATWWEFRHPKFIKNQPHLLSDIKRSEHYVPETATVHEVAGLRNEVSCLADKIASLNLQLNHLTTVVNTKALAPSSSSSSSMSYQGEAMHEAQKKRKVLKVPSGKSAALGDATSSVTSTQPAPADDTIAKIIAPESFYIKQEPGSLVAVAPAPASAAPPRIAYPVGASVGQLADFDASKVFENSSPSAVPSGGGTMLVDGGAAVLGSELNDAMFDDLQDMIFSGDLSPWLSDTSTVPAPSLSACGYDATTVSHSLPTVSEEALRGDVKQHQQSRQIKMEEQTDWASQDGDFTVTSNDGSQYSNTIQRPQQEQQNMQHQQRQEEQQQQQQQQGDAAMEALEVGVLNNGQQVASFIDHLSPELKTRFVDKLAEELGKQLLPMLLADPSLFAKLVPPTPIMPAPKATETTNKVECVTHPPEEQMQMQQQKQQQQQQPQTVPIVPTYTVPEFTLPSGGRAPEIALPLASAALGALLCSNLGSAAILRMHAQKQRMESHHHHHPHQAALKSSGAASAGHDLR